MPLGDVEHQRFAQRLIQRALSSERMPHAYLFHGPEGVGKETLAIGLAELLLCGSAVDRELEGERRNTIGLDRLRAGCGTCEDCRAVAAGTHPDLHLIHRRLNREHPEPEVRRRKALELGVDVMRHFVIGKVGLTPTRGRAKVFIVREADRMTVQAQNALLKTLEEPPGATVIILLVTALDRLLPTTLSRCQGARFDALPTGFIQARLSELLPALPAEQVEWYARSGEGSLGRALQYAGDGLFEVNNRVLDSLAGLMCLHNGRSRAPSNAQSMRSDRIVEAWTDESKSLGDRYRRHDPDITETEASRRGFKCIFHLAAQWYADVLRCRSSDQSGIINKHRVSHGAQPVRSSELQHAIDAVSRIARAEHELDLNANRQLCVETLVNDLARMGRRAMVSVS